MSATRKVTAKTKAHIAAIAANRRVDARQHVRAFREFEAPKMYAQEPAEKRAAKRARG